MKRENLLSSYNLFLRDISSFDLLSKERTNELLLKAQSGDKKSRDELVYSNLRLVKYVANKFRFVSHMEFMDLIQEGSFALIKAIENYSFEKQVSSFPNFACVCITNAIKRSIDNQERFVRLPSFLELDIYNYLNLVNDCKLNNIKLPSDNEIMGFLDISNERLKSIRKALSIKVVSSEESVNTCDNDHKLILSDLFASYDKGYEKIEEKSDLRELLVILKKLLSIKEYYIFYERFVYNKIYLDISKELFVSDRCIGNFIGEIKEKIRVVIKENSNLYKMLKKDLKISEGSDFDKLSIEPIRPEDIVVFYYLFDRFSELERQIYIEMFFGKYVFSLEDISKKYSISVLEVEDIVNGILNLKEETVNDSLFISYKEWLLTKLKTKIYKLDYLNNSDISNYSYNSFKLIKKL